MSTIVSLCTGFGALDQAVQDVCDAELIAVADTDRAASKLLAHHHPTVPNLGDITTADWAAFSGAGWVTAGWPCQPWSGIGQRRGVDDERAIWPAVRRAVREIRPRHVLLENVPRIAAVGELARAVGDLAALGYVGSWRCVSAADVGAPHLRERIFIVASDADQGGWGTELKGPAARESNSHRSPAADSTDDRLPRTWAARRRGYGSADRGVAAADASCVARSVFDRDGASVVERGHIEGWGPYYATVSQWGHVLGRRAPSPTVLGPRGGPVLSPYFTEWLMGVDEGWITGVPGLSRGDMVKLCGNGVVKQSAMLALRQCLAARDDDDETAA